MRKNSKTSIEIASEVIAKEAEALQILASSLDENFSKVVEVISKSKGKVLVTGLGKSGVIAMKIAATLNSTGTRAQYMHGADALHGDIGTLSPEDVVMIVSKSGNTFELEQVAKIVKDMRVPLISMVSNKESELAKLADYILYVPVSGEACINGLAPTVSTTAQLAMGDAIAIALESLSDYSPYDFAKVHPGGELGEKLRKICNQK